MDTGKSLWMRWISRRQHFESLIVRIQGNPPVTFQRLAESDMVLASLHCLAYLDDIIVPGKTSLRISGTLKQSSNGSDKQD